MYGHIQRIYIVLIDTQANSPPYPLLFLTFLLTLLTHSSYSLSLLSIPTHSSYSLFLLTLLTHSPYSLSLLTLLTHSSYPLSLLTLPTHSPYPLFLPTLPTHSPYSLSLPTLLTHSPYSLSLITLLTHPPPPRSPPTLLAPELVGTGTNEQLDRCSFCTAFTHGQEHSGSAYAQSCSSRPSNLCCILCRSLIPYKYTFQIASKIARTCTCAQIPETVCAGWLLAANGTSIQALPSKHGCVHAGVEREYCVSVFTSVYEQGCASTVYGTVYGYTVRYGNTAYNSNYTILDHIYGKIRYGKRYGLNFESLTQKVKT